MIRHSLYGVNLLSSTIYLNFRAMGFLTLV